MKLLIKKVKYLFWAYHIKQMYPTLENSLALDIFLKLKKNLRTRYILMIQY